MSIDKFLNKLETAEQASKERLVMEKEKQQQEKIESDAFLAGFNSYYSQSLVKDFNNLREKLKEKFELKYDETPKLFQYNNLLGKVTLTPKFESFLNAVTISITCEGTRKLISITVDGSNFSGQTFRGRIPYSFQDNFEAFLELNMEAEFEKILEKCFLDFSWLNRRQ